MLYDVSELKKLQEDLRSTNELLEELLANVDRANEIQIVRADVHREVFDTKGAMEFLNIGRSMLMEEVHAGRIRYARNGANFLFRKEWLLAWLDAGGRNEFTRMNGKVVKL